MTRAIGTSMMNWRLSIILCDIKRESLGRVCQNPHSPPTCDSCWLSQFCRCQTATTMTCVPAEQLAGRQTLSGFIQRAYQRPSMDHVSAVCNIQCTEAVPQPTNNYKRLPEFWHWLITLSIPGPSSWICRGLKWVGMTSKTSIFNTLFFLFLFLFFFFFFFLRKESVAYVESWKGGTFSSVQCPLNTPLKGRSSQIAEI